MSVSELGRQCDGIGDFARIPLSHSAAHSHRGDRASEMVSRRRDALRYKTIKFGANLIDKGRHCTAVEAIARFMDLCGPIVIQHICRHFSIPFYYAEFA